MKGLATSCRALAFRARNAGAPTFALLAVLALAVVLVGPAQGEPASGTTARAPRTDVKNPLKEAQARFNERRKAAGRAAAKGLTQPTAEAAQLATPGEAPHYFSVPNYANSPLPEIAGAVISVGNPLIARTYATDFPVAVGEPAPVFVVVPKPLPDGLVQGFQTFNQATAGASPFPSAGNVFHAYVLRPTANPNEYRVVYDSGLFTVPALADPGTGAVETYAVPDIPVQAGDVLGFYGQGIPVDTGAGDDVLSHPAQQPVLDQTIALDTPEFPLFPQARTYSFGARVLDLSGENVTITGGIRKFVDTLPGLGEAAANNLGQYIPVAVADTTTYPGADYYEIAVVEYEEQLHSDLAPTKLRGYVQLETATTQGKHVDLGNGYFAVDEPHYLGPAIAAEKDRPVRVLFRNLLPTGQGGNLFLPVDTTVMGSGMGPNMASMDEPDPQNPMCGELPKSRDCYAENRATLHLHGGITPWISDGTPHQWITPTGEDTAYPKGVSVRNVPDMPDPGPGAQTFFYTNQQSARLMFYHDHAWGITRLNVYGGEAAPYLLTDAKEQELVDTGVLPAEQIPLVIQDKTFVPSLEQLALQDPTWDPARWGDEGDLWMPHVYVPAQNPGDSSGVNQFGRWAYGPWFWPPTSSIENGPVANPYFDPQCDPDAGWCEPPLMPGTPFLSMGMESFQDTPVVNGTAYPTVTLEPKSYRLRILNAANDRFWNLSLYKADPNAPTEVQLNPAEVAAALDDPAGVFPTPAAGTEGPPWVQVGTEGGFLPTPTVVPAQPITWVTDPTVFNAGNVDRHSLLLAPAERADVVVDFSQYAGQTLILYNDAPAAFPARDPRYDYYTGNADLRDTGGAPSTLPGYGPNTRTVMQIVIAEADPAPAFGLATLEAAFAHQADGTGVFEDSQNPIIVGQGAYNAAYGSTFANTGPLAGLAQIYDTSLTFKTLTGDSLTMPLRPKQIQDEMGEAFEHEYGRMSGFLGVETPNAQAGLQNMILYPYAFPPTEIIDGVELPAGVDVEPIASADDGTQLWKVTHNGVDTHPIHFHLYEIQLINRVGWDGIIRKPDPNELGWKDTVRISPLEDTIVALRPIIPTLPFDVPNSIRLLDPSKPEGAFLDNADTTLREAAGLPIMAFNPDGEPIDIKNHYVNFGWEYVVHCHILSHEEMDMMRTQIVAVAPKAPTGLTVTQSGTGNQTRNNLTWQDTSANETAFVVERSSSPTGPWSTLATLQSDRLTTGPGTGARTYSERVGRNTFYYQVYAINTVGDTWNYADPALNELTTGGFPTLTLDSRGTGAAPLAAPSGLTATAAAKNNKAATVTINWTDNSPNETGFLVQRAENAGFSLNVTNTTVAANTTVLVQSAARGKTFYYRVQAFDDTRSSPWSNTASVTTP